MLAKFDYSRYSQLQQ